VKHDATRNNNSSSSFLFLKKEQKRKQQVPFFHHQLFDHFSLFSNVIFSIFLQNTIDSVPLFLVIKFQIILSTRIRERNNEFSTFWFWNNAFCFCVVSYLHFIFQFKALEHHRSKFCDYNNLFLHYSQQREKKGRYWAPSALVRRVKTRNNNRKQKRKKEKENTKKAKKKEEITKKTKIRKNRCCFFASFLLFFINFFLFALKNNRSKEVRYVEAPAAPPRW